jgi:ribosomal protein S12 methylthiotransferase accessory factor
MLAPLEQLVSPYTGIVRHAPRFLHAPDEPRLAKVGAETTAGADVLGVDLAHLAGGSGGSAATVDAARAAALGEAAERYSGSYLPEHEFVLATAAELGAGAVAPGDFALFHEQQYAQPDFPFAPFTATTRVRWTRGFRVHDRRRAWLPVQLVYLGWRLLGDGEVQIGYSSSNGMACGETLDEALLRALLELVERDAFMLAWSNRLSLPRLRWGNDDELTEFERRHFAPTGLRYDVVDLSCLLRVPTALAVVRDVAVGAPLGVGAGSAPTMAGAWRKALAEAFAVRAWAAALDDAACDRVFRDDFADVASFADHVHFYAAPERAVHASFLTASLEEREARDVPPLEGETAQELISSMLARLDEAGVDAYAVDVTAPDVREAGLHVVKAVCPQLCALDVMHAARFLGGRRILHAAYDRGLVPAPIALDELNPYPHPFP